MLNTFVIVCYMCNLVQPKVKFSLCLWLVWKVWVENAIEKISTVVERAIFLQTIGDIMYGHRCGVDEDPIDWALLQLEKTTNIRS